MNEVELKSAVEKGNFINLFGIIDAVWRNRVLFILTSFFCVAIALFMALTATPMYTAKSSMLPHRSGAESSVASSLAMFYGSPMSGTTYEDLIEEIVISDKVLDSLIEGSWDFLDQSDASLIEIFNIVNEDSLKADFALRNRLRNNSIMIHRDLMTGFITISVKVPRDPKLAATLTNTIVDKVVEFNFEFHDSHVQDKRIYLENRLDEIQVELIANESRLADFIRNNRSYASSPDLLQQYAEMKRNVDASNAAWLEVRRQLEVALLEAHKGPPVVEVLDVARPPVIRTSPKRKIMVVIGGLLGVFLGLGIVLAKEYLPLMVMKPKPRNVG